MATLVVSPEPPALRPAVHRARLRTLLAGDVCHLAPETPDGLMARMVAMAGFELAYIGLLGSALNRIGSPDAGLLTASEAVDNAARAIGASQLPTIVDAGTGFGNPFNVLRTVGDLLGAGAAAVLLRDGEEPRRHRLSREPIPLAEMAAKLRAARDAAAGSELVLIAGIEDAASATAAQVARRASAYREAGADLVHLGWPGKAARLRELAAAVQAASPRLGLSCDLTPRSELDAGQLAALGFRLAFVPHCGLMAAVPAIERTFAELARTGSVGHLRPHIADFRQFTDIAGLPRVQALEARYGVPDEQRAAL